MQDSDLLRGAWQGFAILFPCLKTVFLSQPCLLVFLGCLLVSLCFSHHLTIGFSTHNGGIPNTGSLRIREA